MSKLEIEYTLEVALQPNTPEHIKSGLKEGIMGMMCRYMENFDVSYGLDPAQVSWIDFDIGDEDEN